MTEFPLSLLGLSLKNPNADPKGCRRRKWKRKRVGHSHCTAVIFKYRYMQISLIMVLLSIMSIYPEPSPEERLQKLHTDIKFALKVDNPVRRSFPYV